MKKILVVVDMQNDFIDQVLGSPEAKNIVPNVIQRVKEYISHGNAVFFTQDTHPDDYLESQEGKNLPVQHAIKGSSGWQLCSEIKELIPLVEAQSDHPVIIEKPGFGSLELIDEIKKVIIDEKDTQIEIIGLCTDICVMVNVMVLKTGFPETKLVVDANCCAGTSSEYHTSALQIMNVCQVEIKNFGF
ncbi:MAG: hypothetical protein ATN36_08880 [Epulopiscium sp. Nele67-Bin005]|nr:MAG: hypothetical protein ATN36_08880 [Epulopiscium sp. Nele67-Bin005]